jgi:predicted Zn-dependent protease
VLSLASSRVKTRLLYVASSAIETYEELQSQYDRGLQEYQQAEARYREARDANPSDPALKQDYARLEARREELARLYEQVREMRSSLASQRDQALSRAAAR